ncbi:DUF5615 family PIN-like protein [Humisphaera borealis]|uniref:DUF5615 family PIN-like protein n=1 Tax=Humisphaera borealis TaxID=2807512 RepID=A0A7M2WYR0_9BACT|nr:DUF5615 family PIN-like protein [Humisphaera borealis]QOV90504.1 DUF5615 family PIN-like protein [Humisphaera borealis]
MRFLIDAQLPRRAVAWFAAAGCEARHCEALVDGNRTGDLDLARQADRDDMIVVTKDSDYVDGHLLRGCPKRLLLISTGNIGNQQLQLLLTKHLASIVQAFVTSVFLELDASGVSVRG